MIALTALLGWRGALIVAGLLAFVVLGAMLLCGHLLRDEAQSRRSRVPRRQPPRPAREASC